MKAIFALLLLVVVVRSNPVQRRDAEEQVETKDEQNPPTEEEVKAALKNDIEQFREKLEAYFNRPEVQAKLREFIKKLFPEGTDMSALENKLRLALEAKEGKEEKVVAVLKEAGFDPEKFKAELKAAFEQLGKKIKEVLENPEVQAKIEKFVQQFLPPGVSVEDLKAKLEEALEPEDGPLEKFQKVIQNSGVDFKAMWKKIQEYFDNPENIKKIEEAIKKVVQEDNELAKEA